MNIFAEPAPKIFKLSNTLQSEQSIQCSIDGSSGHKSTPKQQRVQTPNPRRNFQLTAENFLYHGKTEQSLKKYFFPQFQPKYTANFQDNWYKSGNFTNLLVRKSSTKQYAMKLRPSSQGASKKTLTSQESKSRKTKKAPKKVKTIMEYYHELVEKPKKPKRTMYNYHRKAGCNSGYKTKLQKDPKIGKDPLGNYIYIDTYKSDARKQSKIIMLLN